MRICYWYLGEEACCQHYSSLNQSGHQEDVTRRDMSQDPSSRRLRCETSQVLPCCLLWCLDKNYCVDPRAARTRMASIKSPQCCSLYYGPWECRSTQPGRAEVCWDATEVLLCLLRSIIAPTLQHDTVCHNFQVLVACWGQWGAVFEKGHSLLLYTHSEACICN